MSDCWPLRNGGRWGEGKEGTERDGGWGVEVGGRGRREVDGGMRRGWMREEIGMDGCWEGIKGGGTGGQGGKEGGRERLKERGRKGRKERGEGGWWRLTSSCRCVSMCATSQSSVLREKLKHSLTGSSKTEPTWHDTTMGEWRRNTLDFENTLFVECLTITMIYSGNKSSTQFIR